MAYIIDKYGRIIGWTDRDGNINFFDSDINVYDWNSFPYNDVIVTGQENLTDKSGKLNSITDKSGKGTNISDKSGNLIVFNDLKEGSMVTWDSSVVTWDSGFWGYNGYKI